MSNASFIHAENLREVQQALTSFPRKVKEVARGWAREVAYVERDLIRRNIHSRSGRTAASIQVFASSQGEREFFWIRVGRIVGYLEAGTGIYAGRGLIFPRRAKVLRFVIGGRVLYRPYVRGMRPQGVITRARNEMGAQMPGRLKDLEGRIGKVWKG